MGWGSRSKDIFFTAVLVLVQAESRAGAQVDHPGAMLYSFLQRYGVAWDLNRDAVAVAQGGITTRSSLASAGGPMAGPGKLFIKDPLTGRGVWVWVFARSCTCVHLSVSQSCSSARRCSLQLCAASRQTCNCQGYGQSPYLWTKPRTFGRASAIHPHIRVVQAPSLNNSSLSFPCLDGCAPSGVPVCCCVCVCVCLCMHACVHACMRRAAVSMQAVRWRAALTAMQM